MKPTLLTVSKSVQIYLPIKKSQTMNKIFTTLLLLLCAVAVNAQTQITTLEQFSNTKAYILTTTGRGLLQADWNGNYLKESTGEGKLDNEYPYENTAQHFVFPKINGKTYLYSVGRALFVSKPSSDNNLITLTSEPQTPVKVTVTDGKFTIAFDDADNSFVNLSEGYQAVASDNATDEGSQFTFTELANHTMYHYVANLVMKESGKTVKTYYGMVNASDPSSTTVYEPGDWYSSYVTITAPDQNTVTEDGQLFTFTGEVHDLPFVSSSSYQSATWYQMNFDHSDSKYAQYVADATTAYPLGESGKTSDYLWAFNAENPYKILIYNLAAGDGKVLLSTGDYPKMGVGTNQDYWVLAYASNGFGLQLPNQTSKYLSDVNNQLGIGEYQWNAYTWVVSLTQPEYKADDITTGSNWGDVAENDEAKAYKNNPSAVTYDAWVKHAEYVGSNGYVTLHIGAADGKNIGLDTETYLTASDKAGDDDNADAATDVSQLWEVTSVAQGKVRIKNVSTGKYIQQATNFTQLGAEPFDYSISWDGEGKVFCLHNNDASSTDDYFQYKNQYGYVSFVAGSDQTNAQFSFSPVSTLKNAMHTVNGVSYSTLYMPFGVKLEDGFTAYTATLNGDHFDLTSLGQNVPAETAVVIEGGENATWATFSKADGISEVEKGDLKGTVVPMTWDQDHFWSLGNGGIGAAGFYAWHSGTTLPAGRAYFDDTNVSTTSAKGAAFGTETTGLDKLLRDATVIPANAPRYNLAGQRVDKNYKGVVVVNGKKMMQK